jgi:hypothetical protein
LERRVTPEIERLLLAHVSHRTRSVGRRLLEASTPRATIAWLLKRGLLDREIEALETLATWHQAGWYQYTQGIDLGWLTPNGLQQPHRVQLSRARGWRKPEGVVVVSRPTKWGNPYQLEHYQFARADGSPAPHDQAAARAMAVRDYRHALGVGTLKVSEDDVKRELAGKPLACWCSLSGLCHADALLGVANGEDGFVDGMFDGGEGA